MYAKIDITAQCILQINNVLDSMLQILNTNNDLIIVY
jgi:hypothetical protein